MTTPFKTPHPEKLRAIQLLCDTPTPYAPSAKLDALFVEAMSESIAWHRENSQFYARFSSEFDVTSMRTVDDCSRIPFLPANFFKLHEILSIPREQVAVHLTSSGTTGQKSQIFFDEWSIQSAQRMVDWIFDHYGWITPDQAANYLLYSYEPQKGLKVGTSFTDHYLCKYAPVNETEYALKSRGIHGGHDFDVFGCIEALRRFEKQGLPVRIFGFPAFFHFTLERMRELGMEPLKLHPDSFVFLGGGWKGHADRAIEKREFYRSVNEMLAIPDSRIRDGFGSVEHCIPYIECEHHQFHVPVWSRVFIRDVETLATLPYGEKGFLQFVSPYITSVPAQAVMMGDLASLHAAESCGCGLPTPYFVIHGRAGTSKSRSCAVAASEMMGRTS